MTDHKRRLLRRGPLTGIAMVMALLLAACSGAEATSDGPIPTPEAVSSADLAEVTLRVGDQKPGLESLLRAAGELEGTPYTIEWSQFTAGPPILEAANSQAIDVGSVGNTPPIFAGAAGSKIAIVSASKFSSKGDAILVAQDSPLQSVADLKGKKVAVGKGTSAHGHILLALERAGVTPKDVEFAYMPPSDGYAALKSGSVDAWVVWDPYSAAAETEIGARVLEDGAGLTNGLNFQIASTAALADPGKNTAIQDLVERSARAYLWAEQNPGEWANVYTADSGLDLDVTTITAERSAKHPVLIDDQVVADTQKLTDILAENRFIPRTFDVNTIVDRRYNDALAPTIGED